MTTTTNNSSKNTGQTNKKRSSSKTNDKSSTQRISTHHHHHHHRCNSRPRSGSSSLPTTPTSSTSSSQDHRRPSTKQPLPVSEAPPPPPRLSIADRFMSPTFSLSNTSSTTTALSNSALSNSALSDVQSKLSVADRFMNSPTTTTTSNTSKKIIANTRHSSPNMDPVPGKLTIAETFMRQSRSRAQSVGEMDLGVVRNNQKESKITPSSSVSTTTGTLSTTTTTNRIHPLDSTQKSPPTTATTTKTRTSTSIHFFDDDQLNLDLSLPTNSLSKDKGRRPFGSQDTLVPKNDDKNNKNKKRTETKEKKIIPIYAQFIESEKNTFLSSSSLSQYISQDEDERYSFLMDDYYSDHQHRERRDTAITIVASEEDEEEKKGQFEKKYNHDHLSEKWQYDHADEEAVVRKYDEAIRYKSRKLEQEEDGDDVKPNGFWIGCCFITCGKRPSQAMLKQKENKRRRKRKESDESEEEEQLYNNNEHRKPNKTNKDDKNKKKQKRICCSRRGWVFSIFLGVLITALIIYLLFPRTPLMRIEGAKLVTPAKITQTKQGSAMMTNVAFESQWLVNVTVDNRQNHVPTRLTKIQVLAKDALTGLVIGKGVQENEQTTEYVLPPNSISTIQLPIHVDYQARDSTDTTFVDLTKSCQNASTHEVLPLHFWMTLHFFGLDWLGYKPTLIATPATGGFVCPLS